MIYYKHASKKCLLEYRLQRRNQYIKDFLSARDDSPEHTKRNFKCDTTRISVTKALENMVRAGFNMNGFKEEFEEDVQKRRQCFGRELCLRMLEDRRERKPIQQQEISLNHMISEFEKLFLMYQQLSDHSVPFTRFLEDIRYDEQPKHFVGCYDMFISTMLIM